MEKQQNQLDFLTADTKRILDRLQDGLPLVERPFAEIGAELQLPEAAVLAAIRNLLETGLIRRLSGFFEPRRLGYTSTLCAMQVPENELHSVAAVINEFPEVTHNYWRENQQYNLWFTIIAQGNANIARICREIEAGTGYRVTDFVATRFFKIQVRFAVAQKEPEKKRQQPANITSLSRPLLPEEKCLVHALGQNLAIVEQPYAELAGCLNAGYALPQPVSQQQVLELARRLQQQGYLRRIGAVIKHTEIGYNANWMVVWNVPDEQVEAVGQKLAAAGAVSHCYCRKRQENWPWNLYTMLHAADSHAAQRLLEQLQSCCGIADYVVLPTYEELKKTGMRYFPEMQK